VEKANAAATSRTAIGFAEGQVCRHHAVWLDSTASTDVFFKG
jgi:hypothetical protein